MSTRCVALCLVLALGVITGCAPGGTDAAEPTAPPEVAATPTRATPHPSGHWARILHRLDRRRGSAFVHGDPSMLGRVYLPHSQVRRRDARLLRAYERRGLELDSVRMRLRSVEQIRQGARRLTLRVVDRLAPVRVRGDGGSWRALPRDRATERVVTLWRTGHRWRIAGIRRVAG